MIKGDDKMKKVIYGGFIILCMVLMLSFSLSVSAEEPIRVFVDGYQVQSDVDPIVIDGRTMLPARAVFELFGAEVSYDPDTRTVTAIRGEKEIKITINSNTMYINGEAVELDVPATIVNSRTLVPVRACADALSSHVEWFGESRSVKISSEAYRPALEMAEHGKVLEGKLLLEALGNDPYAKSLLRRFIVKPKTELSTYIDYREDKETNLVISYVYDDKGNLEFYQDDRPHTYTYEYDEYGRVTKKTERSYFDNGTPCVNEYEYQYKGEWIWRTDFSIDEAGGDMRYYIYDDKKNLIREDIYAPGYINYYEYDEYNNCIKYEQCPAEIGKNGGLYPTEHKGATNYKHIYDENGKLIKTDTYDENGRMLREDTYEYSNGRLIRLTSNSSDVSDIDEYEYNEDGTVSKETNTWIYKGQKRTTSISEYKDYEVYYFPHIPQVTEEEMNRRFKY